MKDGWLKIKKEIYLITSPLLFLTALPHFVSISIPRHGFCSDGRFEPDMLAFSGCYYGGGEKERRELAAIRKRWRTLHVRAV